MDAYVNTQAGWRLDSVLSSEGFIAVVATHPDRTALTGKEPYNLDTFKPEHVSTISSMVVGALSFDKKPIDEVLGLGNLRVERGVIGRFNKIITPDGESFQTGLVLVSMPLERLEDDLKVAQLSTARHMESIHHQIAQLMERRRHLLETGTQRVDELKGRMVTEPLPFSLE